MKRTPVFTAGLTICGLLGLFDVVSIGGAGEDGPPLGIVVAAAALGVLTLVGVVMAWRGKRFGVATVVVSRVLAALLNLPVYFLDAPTWVLALVTALLVLTVVGVAMLTVRSDSPAVV
ncbi:hypothetical protein FKR81_01130 [Lentzea tibetensis]|uniref:Integral membrane protein n=1 Tax=Lentzea tibetensis TaxID=2591470 RepID=A0A563F2K9_9PSEU|nr:hypothetical protein [Lentzea tibetensis]TWP54195.1 hypothetical protein FKR81_01130 [Lentzea tibetensis]